MGQPRGKGRAVIKGELRAALAQLQRLLKCPQLLPKLKDLVKVKMKEKGMRNDG